MLNSSLLSSSSFFKVKSFSFFSFVLKIWKISQKKVVSRFLVSIPYAPDGLLVRLKHLDVVHVGLPIFDVTSMVPSHHPGVVVGPDHTPNRTVVSLKSIKVTQCL